MTAVLSVLVYATYAVSSVIQTAVIYKRVSSNAHDTNVELASSTARIHLVAGRLGILCLTIGTGVDNFRHVLEGLVCKWPLVLLGANSAENATLLWKQHGMEGAYLLRSVLFFCKLSHILLVPVGLYPISQIWWKVAHCTPISSHNGRDSSNETQRPAFRVLSMSTVFIVGLVIMNITVFMNGPMQSSLIINPMLDGYTLDYTEHGSKLGLVDVVTWQVSLLCLGFYILFSDKDIRFQSFTVVVINCLCLLLQGSREVQAFIFTMIKADKNSRGVITNFAEQLAISTLVWMDGAINQEKISNEKLERKLD